MTKSLNATFAAALLAASLFGGSAAFAGGDYYQGVSPTSGQDRQVDRIRTDSIGDRVHTGTRTDRPVKRVGPANGDYYPGLDSNAASDR